MQQRICGNTTSQSLEATEHEAYGSTTSEILWKRNITKSAKQSKPGATQYPGVIQEQNHLTTPGYWSVNKAAGQKQIITYPEFPVSGQHFKTTVN